MKNDKKKDNLFQSYRWNGDTGTRVVGHKESSKREREESKKRFDNILKDRGIK